MEEPRLPAADASRQILKWGLAGSGTVAVGGGIGGILAATHIVHAPPAVAVALCILSAVSILSSSAVAIVKIRTDRPPEVRRAEARAAAMKSLSNKDHALAHDTLDTMFTENQIVGPAQADQCIKLLSQLVNQPKDTPHGPQTPRTPNVPAQLGSSETPSDAQLQQMVSGTPEPDCDALMSTRNRTIAV